MADINFAIAVASRAALTFQVAMNAPSAPIVPSNGVGETFIVFYLDNLRHIQLAYGRPLAERLARHVFLQLGAGLEDWGLLQEISTGVFELDLSHDPRPAPAGVRALARRLELLVSYVHENVYELDGVSISCFVSYEFSGGLLEHVSDLASRSPHFCGLAARNELKWQRQYCADMKVATDLLRRLRDQSSDWCWRPVGFVASSGAPLMYYLDLYGRQGECTRYEADTESLERVGLSRAVDRLRVRRAVDHLERYKLDFIAVQVTGSSASLDMLWDEIRTQLGERRDIARRLVLEILPSALNTEVQEVSRFSHAMTKLGCLVGLGGFGVHAASVELATVLKPALIRIGGRFSRRAIGNAAAAGVFKLLLDLAHALCPLVVVDGIDTQQQQELAHASGAQWAMGDAVGLTHRTLPQSIWA